MQDKEHGSRWCWNLASGSSERDLLIGIDERLKEWNEVTTRKLIVGIGRSGRSKTWLSMVRCTGKTTAARGTQRRGCPGLGKRPRSFVEDGSRSEMGGGLADGGNWPTVMRCSGKGMAMRRSLAE